MTMASATGGTGSTITAPTGTAATNLFGVVAPTVTAGAGVFDPNNSTSFNSSTSMTVFDSLGRSHVASLYFVKTNTNSWNAYLTVDGALVPPAVGAAPPTPMSPMTFSTSGVLSTPAAPVVSVGFTPAGAAPQTLTFDFSSTSQFGGIFGVNSLTQDGYASGRLTGFSTEADGIITGRYSNGQAKTLGQVVLANFTNPQGLQPMGANNWAETSTSGTPLTGVPGSSSLGVLQTSAVEDANVDLTAELVNMITAQRVYQANAQSVKTQDQILQTIVNLR
jgi:flagellar hook protein FlgE